MNPGHWRQPKIIRLLAAAGLTFLLSGAARVEAQGASCVPCLVIGIDAGSLSTTGELAPGAIQGLRILVMTPAGSPATPEALRELSAAGAITGVAIELDAVISTEALRDVRFVVVRVPPSLVPSFGAPAGRDTTGAADVPQRTFDVRTTITALRAARPDLEIAVDGDELAAAGVPLDSIAPYVEAVIGTGGTWVRLRMKVNPAVEDLVAASLTSGGERVLVPVEQIDWGAVRAFVSRRATVVEVGGARPLTVEEILARYQAQQRRQDQIVRTTIATGTTTLLFEVPGFVAPVTITAETTIFRGPDETNIEERNIRVNGAAIAGGGARSPPQLPLIEAERVGAPPLVITLNEAYRYARDGAEECDGAMVRRTGTDGSRCYVISFEPRSAGRGLARGRAWIDTAGFTLRRLETIQVNLRGAIVSSEQIDDFGRVEAGGGAVWLPVATHVFQAYEGAGFRTPIHRTISVTRYEINSARFDARLQAALASDNVMIQDTPDGPRYLVRRDGTAGRSVAAGGGHSIRSLIAGVLIDPNITEPLPFAGISYVNLNLFNRGAQLNIFFGGLYGQAAWSVPSIAGTRWQAHGSAVGIAARYSDRVFRDGREQYSENLVQRPAQASIGVLRALTPRLRATFDYQLNVTTLDRSVDTSGVFQVPPTVVDHGVVAAIDAERGAWGVRGWWNPARRQGWGRWGVPGSFDPATRDYQRYGVEVRRTVALRTSVSSRVAAAWMAGHDLDRFSRYGFDAFDNPLHGYGTASIRYDQGGVLRSATAWSGRGWRLDAFGDIAVVRDPGWRSRVRSNPGVGVGFESGGPFRTLWSVEWGYGFEARRQDGGRGAQATRITVYRGF